MPVKTDRCHRSLTLLEPICCPAQWVGNGQWETENPETGESVTEMAEPFLYFPTNELARTPDFHREAYYEPASALATISSNRSLCISDDGKTADDRSTKRSCLPGRCYDAPWTKPIFPLGRRKWVIQSSVLSKACFSSTALRYLAGRTWAATW
jgi:hypothetical protein